MRAIVCVFAEQLAAVGRDVVSGQQLRGVRAVAASVLTPARPRRPSHASVLFARVRRRCRRSRARAPRLPPVRRGPGRGRGALVASLEPQPLDALVAQLDSRLHAGCAFLCFSWRPPTRWLQLHSYIHLHDARVQYLTRIASLCIQTPISPATAQWRSALRARASARSNRRPHSTRLTSPRTHTQRTPIFSYY